MIRVVHPGSRIRIQTFTHPGYRIQGSKRPRIPDSDPQHWLLPGGWSAEFDPEKAGGERMDEHGKAEGGGLPTQLLHNTTLSSKPFNISPFLHLPVWTWYMEEITTLAHFISVTPST
jgi:hypothetical protein